MFFNIDKKMRNIFIYIVTFHEHNFIWTQRIYRSKVGISKDGHLQQFTENQQKRQVIPQKTPIFSLWVCMARLFIRKQTFFNHNKIIWNKKNKKLQIINLLIKHKIKNILLFLRSTYSRNFFYLNLIYIVMLVFRFIKLSSVNLNE